MSKEWILVKNEDGSGHLLLRPNGILLVEDYCESTEGVEVNTVNVKAYIKYFDGHEVSMLLTASAATEVLAMIESEQEQLFRFPSDTEQKRAIEQYFRQHPE